MAEFVKADTYKRRRVREELAWNKYLRPMLIAYLRCSHITSEWGNPLTWNHTHFREEKCYCLASEKKSCCLDVVNRETRQKKVFDFCSCTPDQVRLISQGYLGGSPTYPQTAFSIRHIRSYHLTWKHRPIGVQPFALAHDEYLDAFNPLILIQGTNQPRQWRRPMACAVHAYRLILKARDDLEARALHLSSLQKLATLCPRCFGPGELSKCADEPDYIICLDGNFQHKRHSAASREFEEIELQHPPLFLNEDQVQAWDPGTGGRGNVEIPLDPCTAQHTAAADRRHDQFLAFINIVQSGEKSHFAHALIASLLERIAQEEEEGEPRTVGVLYDIGCTLEKGLLNNDLFVSEREKGQLKFGTSVFHAYVHRWSCQLDYNPRLNKGWGLSDGEGLERDWSFLDALVALLRYVTKQHRLDALHFCALHQIWLGQTNIGRSLQIHVKRGVSTMEAAVAVLAELETSSGHATQYFSQQWERQKTSQQETTGNTSIRHLEVQLGRLIEFKENLRQAHARLPELQHRRRNLSVAEFAEMRSLPGTMIALERSIQEITVDLGGPEFQDMAAATDPLACALFRVRLAKENLYESKVGVIEHRKRWNNADLGALVQQRFKDAMNKRVAAVKLRWRTYQIQVDDLQAQYPERPVINVPTLDEVHNMQISDPFWNIGHLTHPDKAWAVDEVTQKGIEAFRTLRSSQEELRRLAREVRNVVLHAFEMEVKLNELAALSSAPYEPGFPNGTRPLVLVQTGGILSEEAWMESQESALDRTRVYCHETVAVSNASLKLSWQALIARNSALWTSMVHGKRFAEGLDEEDFQEHRLNWGDVDERFEYWVDLNAFEGLEI
ncbi:hypothetical protein DFH28DRAFT_1121919 [Melampsora americana]|nr:hypothetical protein DFH28DRAFT_1121919 [Melampsora americana]